jgi:alpha-mannosidase
MVADSVEVFTAGPPVGAIQSRGRLVDADGQTLAGFIQTIEARQTSRVIRLAIELHLNGSTQNPSPPWGEGGVRGKQPPADSEIPVRNDLESLDPWNNYCAARFAWADPDAELSRGVGGCSRATRARRIEAPHYVEIRGERARTTILAAGLPFHRRWAERTLDTLLIVRGERERRFDLAIGIDLRHPMQAAMDLIHPVLCLRAAASTTSLTSAWMFHIDAPHVIATHWEPIVAGEQVVGFRCRLLETAGRAGRVRLRAFRSLASARQVDFQGRTIVAAPIEADDVALVDFTAYEWLELEGYWRAPSGQEATVALD